MKVREALVGLVSCLLLFSNGLAAKSDSSQEPAKPAAPPQEKTAPAVPSRIRVGGQVESAKLVHKVQPKYPKEAKKNHIEGKVRLEAVIGVDGRLKEIKVISGDPILATAATAAVKKWRYRPTIVEGQPVQVVTEIDTNFALNRR